MLINGLFLSRQRIVFIVDTSQFTIYYNAYVLQFDKNLCKLSKLSGYSTKKYLNSLIFAEELIWRMKSSKCFLNILSEIYIYI